MKSLIVMKGICNHLKNIFAGDNIQMSKKYLYRTPTITIRNHQKLEKDYLQS